MMTTALPTSVSSTSASESTLIFPTSGVTVEITIDQSGRVYSFGTSRAVLDILLLLEPDNPRLLALQVCIAPPTPNPDDPDIPPVQKSC